MLIVKAGGGKHINWDYIAQDIASLTKKEKVVVVHGASVKRDEIAKKLDHPTKTITSPSGISSVYTDKQALEIFLMVYAGLVNKQIVASLQKRGVNAVGLSGVDGRLWEGKQKPHTVIKENGKTKLLKNNLTGRVEKINKKLIQMLIGHGFVPVICPPAISFDGEIINTDNDVAVAVMAADFTVEKLVVLFEAPGLLRDIKNEKSIIHKIKKEKLDEYMHFAKGRMKKKILGAQKACLSGVKVIYWGDGRIKNPISNALQGKGTIIT